MYRIATLLYATLFLAIATAPATAQEKPTTERVSVASDGTEGNGVGFPARRPDPAITPDGRYVAFASAHTNLVPDDINVFCQVGNQFYNCQDIFVHDRETGTTELVSVASDGTQANHYSFIPSISADGRYVAFSSWADNLAPGGGNNCFIGTHFGCMDIYVHDRETGTTELVSATFDGQPPDDFSTDGRISADGRFVAFASLAGNLIPEPPGCPFPDCWDIFVRDRETETTERVSVDSDGNPGNHNGGGLEISADGRHVAFVTYASNLVPGDTNDRQDVFVHDRETGTTERVSVASDGTQGNLNSGLLVGPAISADGRYVAFASAASNLVPGDTNDAIDMFVRDRETGTTERVSVASDGTQGDDNSSSVAAFSDDGRYITFSSKASNLVPGDTNGDWDVFIRDRETGTTDRVSVAHDGAEGNDRSGGGPSWGESASMSADGRYVAFWSFATNLVPDDTNDTWDVFVRDRGALIVATEDDPSAFHLSNAMPNPASGSTSLSLRVPEAQDVTARVYDALGRQVAVIHNGSLATGEDVRLEIDTTNLTAGVYVVRVEGETFAETRRVTVVR